MKNKFILLFTNIIGIIFAILAIELIICLSSYKDLEELKLSYTTKPNSWYNINTYYSGEHDVYAGRKPDGIEYKTAPIVVFGCSFAHGQYLNYKQTFSYKLAHMLKRPVYNRAVHGKGLAKMYFQSENETFYKDVPKSDLVIYIMINDHYRRIKSDYISMGSSNMDVTYKKVGDKLIINDYKNPIVCFLHSTYIAKYINSKLVNHYINNPKNADKLTDEVLRYFVETRENLENKWGTKVDFVVVYYDNGIRYSGLLRQKLESHGFKVIDKNELTNEEIYADKYYSQVTNHPTEAAWDLLTPKIVEKLGL